MTQRYLSRTEAAKRIGVAPSTLSRYRLPQPDALIGETRGWLASTIDAWHAQRPGRGARTDLHRGATTALLVVLALLALGACSGAEPAARTTGGVPSASASTPAGTGTEGPEAAGQFITDLRRSKAYPNREHSPTWAEAAAIIIERPALIAPLDEVDAAPLLQSAAALADDIYIPLETASIPPSLAELADETMVAARALEHEGTIETLSALADALSRWSDAT